LYSLGDLWNNFKIGLNVSEAYRYTKNNISDYFIGSEANARKYFFNNIDD
jgi:hypothetical protein